MLYGLLASAFLLFGRTAAQNTCVPGSGGMQQSGDNNYVIDSFEYLYFTYAINQCTAKGIQDPNYYKYTCAQDNGVWWVTKTLYTTNDCSDEGTLVDSWTDENIAEGANGYFKCDGDDNYAALEISTDSACASSVKIVGGLGGCALNPVLYDAKFYCDASAQRAYVQLYDPTHDNGTSTMCNDEQTYCGRWEFTPTCGFAASLGGGAFNVYGKYVSCVVTDDTNSGDGDGEESSAAQFTLVGAVVALIAGLLNH